MKIVHIIMHDKFTNGYIRFMDSQFTNDEHFFFTGKNENYPINIEGLDFYHEYESWKELFEKDKHFQILKSANIVIISGVWIFSPIDLLIRSRMIRKTYFHFWGGDFYRFREPVAGLKNLLRRRVIYYAFRRAKGLIFLVDGEYEQFHKITQVTNKHYVAPMPGDPNKRIDYKTLRNSYMKASNSTKVLVGNSATHTNHHENIYRVLHNFASEDMEIYSPLSYGEKGYREHIITIGYELFGNAFHPITEFMDKDDYIRFLNQMDIGVFNNDRQQGMGNISILLGLGKKIFMRRDIPTWDMFLRRGYVFYDAKQIERMTFNEFSFFDDETKRFNFTVSDRVNSNLVEQQRQAWDNVFHDNQKNGLSN